ncbi:unnamed protein product [Arabidopsis arenosa]|uniref:K Homology domain-containing protein n=1 Tax=Arabidopsis arenosa TaxID=38785 RepID=A0A8S1ZLP6_ARAAE|nr:unnamed protein product [Arabidopsis arenosa]
MASTLRNVHGKRSNFQSEFTGNGGSKRRNLHDDTDQNVIGSEDTVYRYLCPVKKTGSIIGKGGDIAKQIRSDTKSNMRINEALPGCEERVVTIYSTNEELNHFGDDDQIGCVIGKGGQVIQNLRNDTNAQIRVIKDHLPACALTLSHDELLQIIGEPLVVREALYQVASLLHDNPSRFQHLLLSSSSSMHQPGAMLMSAALTNSHRNYAIRQETVLIRVNTSETDEDDCIIVISSKEFYEDQSPAVNAAIRLQQRCSEKVGGAVISEMRSVTRANIRILQKEDVPKIAREDEEMVQITGNPDAMKALTQVILRLRATLSTWIMDLSCYQHLFHISLN